MSLTAIFTYAPRRSAVVGPSRDSGQVTYRNPGIALTVFNADYAKEQFTELLTIAKYIAVPERMVRSFASAHKTLSARPTGLMLTIADSAVVQCISPAVAQPEHKELAFYTKPATAKLKPKSSKPVSIEVKYA